MNPNTFDFNINPQQIASHIFGLFNDSYLDKNIIAKIPYINKSYTSYTPIEIHGSYIFGKIREYYGPIHLQKMYIRLLDQYGNIVVLNGLDFSFTLQMKILYDL